MQSKSGIILTRAASVIDNLDMFVSVSKKFPKLFLGLLLGILASGCKSIEPARKLTKGVKSAIVIHADNVVFGPGISQEIVKNVANRIEKYTHRNLALKGIDAIPLGEDGQSVARLIVDINTLEVEPGTSIMILRYQVSVLSPSGDSLLIHNEHKWKESLDDLAAIIAKDVSILLARCYE